MAASDGGVFSFCEPFYGSMGGTHLNQPVVGMAATPDGRGLLAGGLRRGHLHLRRRRPSTGSTGGTPPQRSPSWAWPPRPTEAATGWWPPTGASSASAMPASTAPPAASTSTSPSWAWPPRPTGAATGWWPPTGASSASATPRFYGSTGGIHLNQPIVGMAATPRRQGLLAGRLRRGHLHLRRRRLRRLRRWHPLNQPIVGMAPTPRRRGYWLVAADGASSPTATPASTARPEASRSCAHRRHGR